MRACIRPSRGRGPCLDPFEAFDFVEEPHGELYRELRLRRIEILWHDEPEGESGYSGDQRILPFFKDCYVARY